LDLVAGYAVAFAVPAIVQTAAVSALAFSLLDLRVAGPRWGVGALAVGNAVLGMSLGLFVSAFARTEFQAVQFMPAVVFPQLLLCGLIQPRAHMEHVLRVISYALPMTWAYDALDHAVRGGAGSIVARDAAI